MTLLTFPYRPAITVVAALAMSLLAHTGAYANDQDLPELVCRAESPPRRPVRTIVIVDDPAKPLDAKDPYFSEKLAARYRSWIAQLQ